MGFIYEISGKYRENRELHKKKRLVPTLDYFFCAMGTDEPDYRYIIGKMVKGRIDRPLGSSHPWYPELIYSLNYGYIEGVFAGDGEEQDVYIFGADKPLTYFEGKVIAVWHRFEIGRAHV